MLIPPPNKSLSADIRFGNKELGNIGISDLGKKKSISDTRKPNAIKDLLQKVQGAAVPQRPAPGRLERVCLR